MWFPGTGVKLMLKPVTSKKSLLLVALLLVALLVAPAADPPPLDLRLDPKYIRTLAKAASHPPTASYGKEQSDRPRLIIKSKRSYPFGLVRFKVGKAFRVRGWEIRENLYFGQAKIGGEWGAGFVWDRGDHYYGLNNRGLSYLKRF